MSPPPSCTLTYTQKKKEERRVLTRTYTLCIHICVCVCVCVQTFDPIVRAKYIEDVIEKKNADVKQVVLLGAGMDTRAFRLSNVSADTTIYEVDFAHSFEHKQTVIDDKGARTVCRRVVVPVDLRAKDGKSPAWVSALIDAGFDTTQKSIFTAEGLLLYLKQDEVNSLLEGVSKLTCTGSTMVGDVLNQAFLQWELAQPLLTFMAENDAPWIYGFRTRSEWHGQWEDLEFALKEENIPMLAFRYKRPAKIGLFKAIGIGFNVTKNRMNGKLDEDPAYLMFVATKK